MSDILTLEDLKSHFLNKTIDLSPSKMMVELTPQEELAKIQTIAQQHLDETGTVNFGPPPTVLQQTPSKKKYDKVRLHSLAAQVLCAEVTKNGIPQYGASRKDQCKLAIDLAKNLIDELEL